MPTKAIRCPKYDVRIPFMDVLSQNLILKPKYKLRFGYKSTLARLELILNLDEGHGFRLSGPNDGKTTLNSEPKVYFFISSIFGPANLNRFSKGLFVAVNNTEIASI